MRLLSLLSIAAGVLLAENIVFSNLLGITPFLKESRGLRPALRHGVTTAFAVFCASIVSWFLDTLIIRPAGLEYLRSVVFVLVAVAGVKLAEAVVSARSPKLSKKLGVSFSLVAANTALLGAMLLTSERGYGFFEALFFGVFAGLGYLAVCLLFAAVRERLEYSEVPKFFEGLPIALITAALVALAFSGFAGIKFI